MSSGAGGHGFGNVKKEKPDGLRDDYLRLGRTIKAKPPV